MGLPRPRVLAIAGAVLALLAALWWLDARRPAVAVPACFARLADALAGNDADGVLACLHPDYGFRSQWPGLWERAEGLRSVLGPVPESERGLARAGLVRVFAFHALNRLQPVLSVREWRELEDGRIEARCDLALDSAQGGPIALRPPLRSHRFVLARFGLSPRLRILAHDPIPVRTP